MVPWLFWRSAAPTRPSQISWLPVATDNFWLQRTQQSRASLHCCGAFRGSPRRGQGVLLVMGHCAVSSRKVAVSRTQPQCSDAGTHCSLHPLSLSTSATFCPVQELEGRHPCRAVRFKTCASSKQPPRLLQVRRVLIEPDPKSDGSCRSALVPRP